MICDSFSPLEAFAEEMVSLQSFDFSSFAQSRSHLTLGPYSCDFDRLSLHIYSHNLCSNEYRKLGLFLKEKFPLSHTKEDIKAREEYISLLMYLLCINKQESIRFSKTTRPDYILYAPESIGLEITEFTTKTDSVLRSIASETFGLGKSAAQIQAAAYQKHKRNSLAYEYHDLGAVTGIASPLMDVNEQKHEFAQGIIKKYDKYKTMLSSFHRFVVLCDARSSFAITYDYDTNDVVKIARALRPDLANFSVHVLYENANSQLVVDQFDF